MNAVPLLMSVVPMLSVQIPQGHTGVSVKLVLLEMDALVRTNNLPIVVFCKVNGKYFSFKLLNIQKKEHIP